MRRSMKWSYVSLESVTARIGTSSIERGLTSGPTTPGGMMSRFA